MSDLPKPFVAEDDAGAPVFAGGAGVSQEPIVIPMPETKAATAAPMREADSTADLFDSRGLLRRLELPLNLGSALLPGLAVVTLRGGMPPGDTFRVTMIMLSLATILGWYMRTRLREHAKSRQLSYVLPINLLVYGCALSAIALLRLPYSVTMFTLGAASATVVSFLFAVRGRGIVKPHLIVLHGRASEIRLEGQYKAAPALADMMALVQSGRRDWAIVADLHYYHSAGWEKLFAQAALAGIPVYHFRQIAEMQTGQVKISHLSENDLGSLIPNVAYMSLKRLIDIVGALVLLPFCLVGFAALAVLIRLDSPGRAFFIQERVGFRGRTFRMIKFRTMRARSPHEEEEAGREAAMTRSDDERITRLGRFLRKTRIDELPQIFNILKGEMSFIGPRPEAAALAEWYEAELPFYTYRHIVRPGITGWAQVNQGHVTDVADVLGKLRYDFYYIRNISLWLDLLVALKTLRVIATGLGAK